MHGWPSAAGFVAVGFAPGQGCPTVCGFIPKEERCILPRSVPDVACETAIIREFLSYSFHVVDQTQVKFLRMTDVSSSPRLW